jgi:hypothetical protein
MLRDPMQGTNPWTLQDPVVSLWNFIPGWKTVRFEILQNKNFLWSNLRGLGLPLLGNEIQVAPLFPLSLFWIWLPPALFWNVLVSSRLFLVALACCLIATEIFKFKPLGAIVFTVGLAYGAYVLRWMNHPWHNGFLAGLWYIYFVAKRILNDSRKSRNEKAKVNLGIAASVYSLMTAGFPESTVMSGIIAVLVVSPILWIAVIRKQVALPRLAADLLVGHLIGFLLSSVQTFATVEFLSQARPGFRELYGESQYGTPQIFLDMVGRLTRQPPSHPIVHVFHLTSIWIFFWGGWTILRRAISGVVPSVFEFSALCCGGFFALKLFPIWPWFNRIIGSLPVFNACWFTIYGFHIFLWFFSYFCARGADSLFYEKETRGLNQWVAFFISTIVLLAFLIQWRSLQGDLHAIRALITVLILAGWLACVALYFRNSEARSHQKLAAAMVLLLFCDFFISVPHGHPRLQREEVAHSIRELIEQKSYSLWDYRERSQGGAFVDAGIATVDDGNPAIMTQRMELFRISLFSTLLDLSVDPHGHLPLNQSRKPYSWQIASSGFQVAGVDSQSKGLPPGIKMLGISDNRSVLFDEAAVSRAYLGSSCIASQSLEHSQQLLLDSRRFAPGKVILERLNSPEEKKFCQNLNGSYRPVKIIRDEGSRIELEEVLGPAILGLNDNYYPGWKIRDLNSSNALDHLEIKPSNLALRGVLLPESKRYQIQFYYQPDWLPWAQGCTALGLLLTAFILIEFIWVGRARRI